MGNAGQVREEGRADAIIKQPAAPERRFADGVGD